MASGLTSASVPVSPSDLLYRGINPMFYVDGEVTTGVFFMKKKDAVDDGPSVGLANLIPLTAFHTLMAPGWGVGEFSASIPQGLGLTVFPKPEPSWGSYANAHAVITDYQSLTNKRRVEVARALTNAVRQNVIIKPDAA
jgi:hypothetical protein